MLDLIQLLLKLNRRKGFTLVELIISVGTLAIAGTIRSEERRVGKQCR